MMNNERLIQTFLELVQIDSETGNEGQIQTFLKDQFQKLGLDVKEDNAQHTTGFGANNLICTLPVTEEGHDKIYFTSHMDTVKPGENVKPQIKDDGYIYSDGQTILGADDKAGLAVILEVLQTIQSEKLPHGQLQFIITVGEESGLVGAKALQSEMLEADYGYAIDSAVPVGDITVGAPYQMKIDAKIYGKKAHAGTPENGVSAIKIASHAIHQMKLGRIDDETTANIGRFEGGGPTNVVTDLVTIWAEARSHSKDKIEAQVQHMKETFINTAHSYGTLADVETSLSYPGFLVEKDATVIQNALKAAQHIGLNSNLGIGGGGSDGNIINGLGIPTVILGVGYENIHTTEERIAKQSLIKLAEFVLSIIKTV